MGSAYHTVKLMFERIQRKLDIIDVRISTLSQEVKAPRGPVQPVYLSVGIQTTVNALKTFRGPATAEQISAVTGRARAVESMHLNELFRMGLARKEKRSRTAFFSLKEEFFDER
ncbi:helix-turn-helix transcriptional regulator [Candidatus Bathyarchaeota archaeon]|nr:helix-turn-helix transcriptional regulator [Candidatus Bathyarchaeota archaeon]